MTTVLRHSSLCLILLGVAVLMVTAPPRAAASDTGRILGAVAAGYLAYELLSDSRCGGWYGSYYPYPHHRYYPPSRCWWRGSWCPYHRCYHDYPRYGPRPGWDDFHRRRPDDRPGWDDDDRPGDGYPGHGGGRPGDGGGRPGDGGGRPGDDTPPARRR